MIELQRKLGQPVDATALAEIMEATRPGRVPKDPLPEWYIVAECMRAYHWTERQYWEDNSPAMILRLLWLEALYAEKQESDNPKKGPSFDGGPSDPSSGGHIGMAGTRQRSPALRR